jgi:hypothetical protein
MFSKNYEFEKTYLKNLLVPGRVFRVVSDIGACRTKYGHCFVVVSEPVFHTVYFEFTIFSEGRRIDLQYELYSNFVVHTDRYIKEVDTSVENPIDED